LKTEKLNLFRLLYTRLITGSMGLEMNVKWGDRGCEEEFNDAAYYSNQCFIFICRTY